MKSIGDGFHCGWIGTEGGEGSGIAVCKRDDRSVVSGVEVISEDVHIIADVLGTRELNDLVGPKVPSLVSSCFSHFVFE